MGQWLKILIFKILNLTLYHFLNLFTDSIANLMRQNRRVEPIEIELRIARISSQLLKYIGFLAVFEAKNPLLVIFNEFYFAVVKIAY